MTSASGRVEAAGSSELALPPNRAAGPGSPSNLRIVWSTIKPRRGRGVLSVVLASLSLLCAIGLIASSAWLISRAWQQPAIIFLAIAVVAVRAFGLGRGVFRYFERLVAHGAALRGLTDLRVRLVERVGIVAPVGVNGLRRGDAMRRLVDDVDTAAEFGLRTVLPSTTAIVVGALVVAFVSWLVPLAGAIMLAGLLVGGIFAPWVTARVGKNAARDQVHQRADLASEVTTLLTQSTDLIAAGATKQPIERIRELDADLLSLEKQTARGMGFAAAIGVAAQGLALIGVVLVAIPAVRSGSLSGVNLAVVVLIPLVAFETVAGLPSAALWLAKARASSERIVALLDIDEPVPDPVTSTTRSSGVSDPNGGFEGVPALLVSEMAVTWPGSAEPAVSGVSFELTAGTRLAIVGPSGCGKSSLAAGLVKFAPMIGDVSLGGQGYQSLTGDAIRKVVGYCEQGGHIFDNTIAENIRFASPAASDSELLDVLARVKLADWVAGLPHGIHTQVGEGGAQLSGGQAQRISLARIVLADPPIAIFDEPTEHLDQATARALTDDILNVMSGRSVIYITHSPYGLDQVDQILTLPCN